MEKITFTADGAQKLANELAESIITNGFNTMSKNDFYDFVLHLLSKYSTENFLATRSNYDNALLLKVKPEKIKASKLNIFLKYDDEQTKKDYLWQIIPMIINGKVKIVDGPKDTGLLNLTIEDPIMRICLDAKMKEDLGVSPDTSFNSEIFVMHQKQFFEILRLIAKENVTNVPKKEIDEIIAQLPSDAAEKTDIKRIFQLVLSGVEEVAEKNQWIPAKTIKVALTLLGAKIKPLRWLLGVA